MGLRHPATHKSRPAASATATIAMAAALTTGPVGCKSVCERLRDRAEQCGASVGGALDSQRSVCAQTRQQLGERTFDPFANCVLAAECADDDAVARCQRSHRLRADACERFVLWAAACGLQPRAHPDDCNETNQNVFGGLYGDWVDCITALGCPIDDDPRYAICQDEVLPAELSAVLDACVVVSDWMRACAGRTDSFLPVSDQGLPGCLIEAQLYTASTWVRYAECLSQVQCDDTAARLDCALRRVVVVVVDDDDDDDHDDHEAPCSHLVAQGQQCGAALGGGSVAICVQLFAATAPDSFERYVDCVEAAACADTAALARCGSELAAR